MSRVPRPVRTAVTAALLAAVATTTPSSAAAKRRDLLPNLVALRTVGLYVGGPTDVQQNGTDEYAFGCHPTEVVNDHAARCLRFETRAANLGAGDLELHYRADQIATTRGVVQRIYRSDGTSYDANAGSYVLDPTHAHFHYTDFALAQLWRSDSRGRRLGTKPVASGQKAGFCLEDVYPYAGRGGGGRFTSPDACYPTDVHDNGEVSQVNGISKGYVDVYNMAVPHQYIEISKVPDGYYLLSITVDPLHRIRESTRADNTSWQRVRLCGDAAELVGRNHACSAPHAAGPLVSFATPHFTERAYYCAVWRST